MEVQKGGLRKFWEGVGSFGQLMLHRLVRSRPRALLARASWACGAAAESRPLFEQLFPIN